MINKQDAPYENQEDDSFKLEEFGYILLAHWHWIILSVAIALWCSRTKNSPYDSYLRTEHISTHQKR